MEIPPEHLARIHKHFPKLEIRQIERNAEGLVNDVYIVNRAQVFRFAKDDYARQALQNEVKVLEIARPRLDLPIPRFELLAQDLASYPLIPGGPLVRNDILKLGGKDQERIAAELAGFLRQLHGIPLPLVEAVGVASSATVRTRADWLQMYVDVRRELFPLMMAHARRWVEGHFEPLLAEPGWMDCQPALVNGDLGPYHVLFDPNKRRINGVIDFGTAGLGDPAVDFSCILYNYGETFLRRMVPHYPQILAALDRSRFWAGTLELQWALAGMRSQDRSWFLVHIGSASDTLPYGLPLR
jgi:aminoglycoside 2''-phosphotransferase